MFFKKNIFVWGICLLCGFIPGIVGADTVPDIILSPTFTKIDLLSHTLWVKDVERKATLNTLSPLFEQRDTARKSGNIKLAYEKARFWFLFRVISQLPNEQTLILEVPEPGINRIKCIISGKDSLIQFPETGDEHLFSSRPVSHRFFLFPFIANTNDTLKVYLMLDKYGESFPLPEIKLMREETFIRQDFTSTCVISVIGSLLGLQVLLSLFLFLFFPRRMYMYYGLYLMCSFMYYLYFTGLGFQYLWYWSDTFNSFSQFILGSLINIFLSLFTVSFYNTRVAMPVGHRIQMGLTGINILLFLGIVFAMFYNPTVHPVILMRLHSQALSTSFTSLYIIATWKTFRRSGRPIYRWFWFALTILWVAAIVWVMALNGMFSSSISYLVYQLSLVIEATLLTLLLFVRLRSLYQENTRLEMEQQRQELEQQQLAFRQEHQLRQEREQMSRELHDNIATQLSFIIRNLDWVMEQKEWTETRLKEQIIPISQVARHIMSDIRDSMWALHQNHHTIEVFSQKLMRYAHSVLPADGSIQLESHFDTLAPVMFNSHESLHLLRIAQEALENAIRHSGATRIVLSLTSDESYRFQLSISDNGRGSEVVVAMEGHYGISNMQLRAKEIQAELVIQNAPGSGFTVTARRRMVNY